MAHDELRLARTTTIIWTALEGFVIVLVTYAFIRTTNITEQPGTIYAVIAYVWAYAASFDKLPSVVQQISGLRGIVKRLHSPLLAR